jgi:hypothetical protein
MDDEDHSLALPVDSDIGRKEGEDATLGESAH